MKGYIFKNGEIHSIINKTKVSDDNIMMLENILNELKEIKLLLKTLNEKTKGEVK